MRIVIAGGGKVGSELTDKLTKEGHEITLVDSNAQVLESIMEQYDIISVQGNAASIDVLEEAGVQNADLLIAATDMDEINLLACLTAHGLNPNLHTIGRIRNPEYRAQAFRMNHLFGLNLAINPEEHAALEISRLLKYPGFLNIETFVHGKTEIVSLKIKEKSVLNNVSLNKMNSIIHCQVLVCAVLRNGECIMPDGNFVLKENDVIYVTAPTEQLSTLLRNVGIIARKVKNVLIAGGGKISYYLAKELTKTGIRVSIIEQSEARCSQLASDLPEATIIVGDASRQEFLDSEGMDKFDAIVTLTGLDELNIVISLYAKERNVPQIITKLSHAEHNRILDSLEIGSVISPKELSCASIIRYVRAMQNTEGAALTVHMIANGKGEAIEFRVNENDKYIGYHLKDMPFKKNVLLVNVTRGMKSEIATGNTTVEAGDVVVVVTNGEDPIREYNDIFED